jgi:hypothetical protein
MIPLVVNEGQPGYFWRGHFQGPTHTSNLRGDFPQMALLKEDRYFAEWICGSSLFWGGRVEKMA